MSDLPKFVADDPAAITAELITAYEAMTGKTLYPAQVERLLIDLIAYRETLVRTAINDTARLNLVAFSRAPILDYLGELVGVSRLPAQSAKATVRLTFAEPLASALPIASGWRAETAGGIQFAGVQERLVPAGAAFADLSMTAIEAGTAANGFLPGQINAQVDALPVDVQAIANLETTSGGSEAEGDDRLRERIRLAPEAFSVAGSRLAYRFHAMSAHPDIVDVAVVSPTPGVVQLYPLVEDGLPGNAVLAAVLSACAGEKVRPLTDQVFAFSPETSEYVISACLTLYASADATTTLARAQAAAETFAAERQQALGKDIVPSQIIAALSVDGVYQVALSEPAATLVLPEQGWAHCVNIELSLAGAANG